jgi:hypothetical protein
MAKANDTQDKEKNIRIPPSISAAALLLIAWVQEQMPIGESGKVSCQQSHVNDRHYEPERSSR